MKFRDLPATKIGQLGEQLTHRLLRNLGAGVIASFKFSGENDNEAPAIEFHDKRIVLPDFDVSMRGKRFWLELKTYKEPQYNRTHRCEVHGIPVRLYDQYCEDEKQTGTPVYLGVLEVSSGSLLVSGLPVSQLIPRYPCLCGCNSDATKCEYRAKGWNNYPQWYFRRDAFNEWHKLEGEPLAKLQKEHERHAPSLRKPLAQRASIGNTRITPSPSGGATAYPISDPWTWTCLPCNTVGRGDSARHRCNDAQQYRRNFWIQRFRWALPKATPLELAALIDQPISREQMAALIGDRWLPGVGR